MILFDTNVPNILFHTKCIHLVFYLFDAFTRTQTHFKTYYPRLLSFLSFSSLLYFQSVDLEVLVERIKQDYLEVQRMFLELRDSPPVRFPIFPFPLILLTFSPTLISSLSPHLHIYLRFCLSLSASLFLCFPLSLSLTHFLSLSLSLSLSLIHTLSLPISLTHTSSASLSPSP